MQILSMDELLSKAQTILSLYDAVSLDNITGGEGFMCSIQHRMDSDAFTMTVELDQAEYGMARIPVPDEDLVFHFTPSLIFHGTIRYYNPLNGEEIGSVTRPLVTVNAVDGTII